MMIEERIQALIHKLEVDAGARWLNYLAMAVIVVALAVWYDTHCYRNFSSPEAMDAAQVARNLSEGNGFTTEFIRPFSIYLLQQHNRAPATAGQSAGTNDADYAQLAGHHPDLANAPLYPAVLAGLFKLTQPEWKVDLRKPFWADGGRFMRYKPEFMIAIFNQILLLAVVLLTFRVAKTIFDAPTGWLAAGLMLGSDELWKFSVSGLPTMLQLLIFLALIWCLAAFEAMARTENTVSRRQFLLAVLAGLLAGLGMLTRYSFGWVIVPVFAFFAVFGGTRRTGLAVTSLLVFAATVLPWLARNVAISGTFFGTAGFAAAEGTFGFPGSKLMQSLTPDMTSAYWVKPYLVKLVINLRGLLEEDVPRLGGGWIGILFLAGLLLGLRNVAARHLRHFTMMCLGIFLVVTALGRTELSFLGEASTENLLVLLTPLVVIFGVAFFLTLLNQMELPSTAMRYGVIGLVVFLACHQSILTLFPPKISPTVYPPYSPPDIQRFARWLDPGELMMSDKPWAVAWYGDRQCSWTTINSHYEYSKLDDSIKHVSALYLSRDALDAKLVSECLQGGVDSWSSFVFERIAVEKIKGQASDTWGSIAFRTSPYEQGKYFPLQVAPSDMYSGLFLTDRVRWETE